MICPSGQFVAPDLAKGPLRAKRLVAEALAKAETIHSGSNALN
jgi:hypothetical protein